MYIVNTPRRAASRSICENTVPRSSSGKVQGGRDATSEHGRRVEGNYVDIAPANFNASRSQLPFPRRLDFDREQIARKMKIASANLRIARACPVNRFCVSPASRARFRK